MKFATAVKTCFHKYAVFSQRASASEFGYWALFLILAYAAIFTLGSYVPFVSLFGMGFFAATLVPTFAVMGRRIYDIERSAYWRARLAIHIMPNAPQYAWF